MDIEILQPNDEIRWSIDGIDGNTIIYRPDVSNYDLVAANNTRMAKVLKEVKVRCDNVMLTSKWTCQVSSETGIIILVGFRVKDLYLLR
ncbi:hypothetical protein D3C76_984950 [compost metagenome]